MSSGVPIDCAVFQLSPRRTRCELFVSRDRKTEKLASGFLKPFVAHLRVVEEQALQASQFIKLEVEGQKNAAAWFNKGTLERFVRFVSTPEVLESANTLDAEMLQLEAARRIYLQGTGDQPSGASLGKNESASATAADMTKKELLKAIDVRLIALKQNLTIACARASAAGFTLDNVSELLIFADRFGTQRLIEACTKFISLCQQRPELICHQPSELVIHQPAPSSMLPSQCKGFDDENIRSSFSSDMSIDEPEVEPGGPTKPLTSSAIGSQRVHNTSNRQPPQNAMSEPAATCQQPKPIVRRLTEKDVEKAKEEPAPIATSAEPAQQVGGGSRRLSVQDRINLFESKQKDKSVSGNISFGGGITNKVAGKPEHRRLPSDISEKSVLRRWSGASDMSIDLNNSSSSWNDRKESISLPETLSSSAHSQAQFGSRSEEEATRLKDTVTSRSQLDLKDKPAGTPSISSSSSLAEAKVGAFPKDNDQFEDVFSEGSTASKLQSGLALEKGQGGIQTQVDASLGKMKQDELSGQVAPKIRSKVILDSGERAGLKKKEFFGTQSKGALEDHVGTRSQTVVQAPSRAVSAIVNQVDQKDQVSLLSQTRDVTGPDAVEVNDQPVSMPKFRTFATKPEDSGVKSKGFLDSRLGFKASSGKLEDIPPNSVPNLTSQPNWRSFPGKEDVQRKEAAASKVSLGAFSVEAEKDSHFQGMKHHRQPSAPDQIRKLQGSDKKVPNQGNAAPYFLGSKAMEGVEVFDPPSMSSMEHAQAVRPSKGNIELNDELQMKANELEKLFAAHKLRVRGDQISSSRRSRPIDMEVDHTEVRSAETIPDQLQEENPLKESSSNEREFNSELPLKMVESRDCSSNMKQGLGDFNPSDDLRGKFYEKYMQKRNAKLREEWGSKRTQKEAKMKAIHDSFERSQAEMKTKFTGSANKQDPNSARRHAEKLRSFNARSSIKSKGQTVEFLQGEEEEDLQELPEQVHYAQEYSYSDTLFGSEHSITIQSKNLSSSKFVSSSALRTAVVPVPRPSVKGTNSGSMKRRTQPENPLAQSVPNFSDFRKENTKPSAGLSKVTPRAQSKNFVRSKSSNEEVNLVKEEKSRKSQSMRKGSVIPGEPKDISPLNSDGANLSPLKFSEQAEPIVADKIQGTGELRPFLRKGNGIGPGAGAGAGAGAGIGKLNAFTASEALKDEEYEGLVDQHENLHDIVKDEEEESEKPYAEGNLTAMDFSVDSDSEKPRLSQESGNSGDPESENVDILRALSQNDDHLAALSSKFDTSAGNMQESPGESPGSWDSHIHHSFSYAHEASDIDASVDSPTGSPPSWNSHQLNQMMDADVARMRKKWGTAHLPVLVANASNQSRKDVTKGFKRLLKFGRKSKGAEFLINDWVSASTVSEGDDDTEDGRDLATRSSDDLRKSRMGYPIGGYDGLNEGEVYREQVRSLHSSIPNPPESFKLREDQLSGSSLKAPRSFFSLSSFRSKGSESKLR